MPSGQWPPGGAGGLSTETQTTQLTLQFAGSFQLTVTTMDSCMDHVLNINGYIKVVFPTVMPSPHSDAQH